MLLFLTFLKSYHSESYLFSKYPYSMTFRMTLFFSYQTSFHDHHVDIHNRELKSIKWDSSTGIKFISSFTKITQLMSNIYVHNRIKDYRWIDCHRQPVPSKSSEAVLLSNTHQNIHIYIQNHCVCCNNKTNRIPMTVWHITTELCSHKNSLVLLVAAQKHWSGYLSDIIHDRTASQTNCQPLMFSEECILCRDQNFQQSTIKSHKSCK
jgi:hypothetical protein